jgi:hypothetical protein
MKDRLCGLVIRVPGYRSRGPVFDFRRYQILSEVMGLERGPLSLVSTTEELFGRNSSDSGLETREYGHKDPLRTRLAPSIHKICTNFSDKRRSLGRFSSLADSGHRVSLNEVITSCYNRSALTRCVYVPAYRTNGPKDHNH